MLGISGSPSSVPAVGHSVLILYTMRPFERILALNPLFPGESSNFLRRMSSYVAQASSPAGSGGVSPPHSKPIRLPDPSDFAPSQSAGTHRGLFHHPCFSAGMRTKCVQNAPKNANVTFLLTRYQPLTISRPQSVRIFMNPPARRSAGGRHFQSYPRSTSGLTSSRPKFKF
jgi:hypothetical protein